MGTSAESIAPTPSALSGLSASLPWMPTPVPPEEPATPERVSRSGPVAGLEETSRNTTLGLAKDKASQVSRTALQGLYGELQRRGLGGAGYEASRIGETVANAVSPIGDLLTLQTGNDLGRAERAADTEFQGGVQQRGQDIQAQQASAARTQSNYQQQLQALLQALRLSVG